MEWFNSVDTTYRGDLRELNELNFARFDAKLEQRAAQLDAKIDRLIADLRTEIRTGLANLETKLIRWMFLFWVGTVGTLIALQRL